MKVPEKMKISSKGISPLVASVMLIAITMTIAGILAYWASSFIKSSLPPTSQVDCTGANFQIYQCSYNATLGRVDIILQNLGRVALENITSTVIYSNNSVSSTIFNETLTVNPQIKSYQINSTSSDYMRITITTACPGVEATTTCGK